MFIKKKRLEELSKQDILNIISLFKEYDEKTISKILNIPFTIVRQIVTNYLLSQRGVRYFNNYISYYLFNLDYDIEEIARRLKMKTNSVFEILKDPVIRRISSPLFYKILKIAWKEFCNSKLKYCNNQQPC
jgi:hypothetical protein